MWGPIAGWCLLVPACPRAPCGQAWPDARPATATQGEGRAAAHAVPAAVQQIFPGLILSDIKPAKRMKFKTVCYLLVQLMQCRKMFKAEIPFSNVMTCEDDDKVAPPTPPGAQTRWLGLGRCAFLQECLFSRHCSLQPGIPPIYA